MVISENLTAGIRKGWTFSSFSHWFSTKKDFCCSQLNVLRMGSHGVKALDISTGCNKCGPAARWLLSFTTILRDPFLLTTVQVEFPSSTLNNLANLGFGIGNIRSYWDWRPEFQPCLWDSLRSHFPFWSLSFPICQIRGLERVLTFALSLPWSSHGFFSFLEFSAVTHSGNSSWIPKCKHLLQPPSTGDVSDPLLRFAFLILVSLFQPFCLHISAIERNVSVPLLLDYIYLWKWLSVGKESVCNVVDPGLIPEWGRSPGEGNGNPSSILAWRIPETEEPGGPQFIGSQRVRHDWVTNTFTLLYENKEGEVSLPTANEHLRKIRRVGWVYTSEGSQWNYDFKTRLSVSAKDVPWVIFFTVYLASDENAIK